MKKAFLILFAIIGGMVTVNAQQTVVLQNQQSSTEPTIDPNIFYINGIPSTQDIGGVEALYKNVEIDGYYLFLKNYNPSLVTVLYQYENKMGINTGSVVLKPDERKIIRSFMDCPIIRIATITRKL